MGGGAGEGGRHTTQGKEIDGKTSGIEAKILSSTQKPQLFKAVAS